MSNLIAAAVQLGAGSVLVRPQRAIATFVAFVTLEEQHDDELEITEHPIELGADITDHAYKRPAQVVIKCGWSNSPQRSGLIGGVSSVLQGTVDGVEALVTGNSPSQVRDIYDKLLTLQKSVVPFDVLTGKRSYKNMLLRKLSTVTDDKTENMLVITAVCQEVLLVKTVTVNVNSSAAKQADPQTTTVPVNEGSKSLQPGTNFSTTAPGFQL